MYQKAITDEDNPCGFDQHKATDCGVSEIIPAIIMREYCTVGSIRERNPISVHRLHTRMKNYI